MKQNLLMNNLQLVFFDLSKKWAYYEQIKNWSLREESPWNFCTWIRVWVKWEMGGKYPYSLAAERLRSKDVSTAMAWCCNMSPHERPSIKQFPRGPLCLTLKSRRHFVFDKTSLCANSVIGSTSLENSNWSPQHSWRLKYCLSKI